jgi:hypothetical protein
MRTHRIIPVLIAVIIIAAAAAAQTAPPAQAQEKKPTDTAKLYAEIAGSYSYNLNGQDMIINFWVENGKLYGAPQGQENEYAEVIIKDVEKLFFEATPPGGQLFEIEFARGESKKIEKSVLRSQGTEVAGIKIK